MLARVFQRIERHLGIVLLLLLVLALWHPGSRGSDFSPGPTGAPAPGDRPRAPRHFLTPDAYRVVVEVEMGRLIVMKGNLLMTVYPIEEVSGIAAGSGEESFLVSEVARSAAEDPAIRLVYADALGADRALSSGRIDQMTHASILDSLARGEVPAVGFSLDHGLVIRSSRPSGGRSGDGIALDEEYLLQLLDIVRVGTPVEVR